MFGIGLLFPLLLGSAAAAGRDYGNARVLRVVRVTDGDTFRADVAGWPGIIGDSIAVRIAGIDTPELRTKHPEVRRLAVEAKAFTADRLGRGVTIELHHIRRGKFFRLVADVEIDGADLGAALLAAGLAKPYDGGRRPEWP